MFFFWNKRSYTKSTNSTLLVLKTASVKKPVSLIKFVEHFYFYLYFYFARFTKTFLLLSHNSELLLQLSVTKKNFVTVGLSQCLSVYTTQILRENLNFGHNVRTYSRVFSKTHTKLRGTFLFLLLLARSPLCFISDICRCFEYQYLSADTYLVPDFFFTLNGFHNSFMGWFKQLRILNSALFLSQFFWLLGGLHNYFLSKSFAFFSVMYSARFFAFKVLPVKFWAYFSTVLFFCMPFREYRAFQKLGVGELVFAKMLLCIHGGEFVMQFNSIIYNAFCSKSFVLSRFFSVFSYLSHFRWLLVSFCTKLEGRYLKRKVTPKKFLSFRVAKPVGFVKTALFQLLFSIQRRGLKMKAFNFIFSFLVFLCFEKSEQLGLFVSTQDKSYNISSLFVTLRLPFQVYNTKVRGKNVQMPVLLPRTKSMVLAFKLFIMSVKKRTETGLLTKLFSEFLDLLSGNGISLKQKAGTFRFAFSNKNLLFFRATRFTFGQQRRKKTIVL